MMIPKSFKLGKKRVDVAQYDKKRLYGGAVGSFYYSIERMAIATRRPKREVNETFWHETTHAILHDMKHPLWNDEKFVTAFSKRLAQVVETAVL